MTPLPKNFEAVFRIADASPYAYQNVYKEGDRWELVTRCKSCEPTCCERNCGMLVAGKCLAHAYGHRGGAMKPLGCCILPGPIGKMGFCTLVWKCVKGEDKGKFRFKCDDKNVLRDIGPDGR
jgi:hypothetical protein